MQPNDAIQNLKAVINGAVQKGVFSDIQSAAIVNESLQVVEGIVTNYVAAQQAAAQEPSYER